MIFKFRGKWIKIKLDNDEKDLFTKESIYLKKRECGLMILESFFDDSKIVKDTYRYSLSYVDNRWQLLPPHSIALSSEFKDYPASEGTNNIVILLESPHKDEFTDKYCPIAPANGATGKLFQKYFPTHALPILQRLGLKLNTDTRYSIILVNPVPYQTSLVEIHKARKLNVSLRNKVWKSLYSEHSNNFKQRLEFYKPQVIINACTKDLKDELNDVLSNFNVQKFVSFHPSTWYKLDMFKRT